MHLRRFTRLARNSWVSGGGFATKSEFNDHSARHEDGGADEINLSGLAGAYITLTPTATCAGPEGSIFYDSDDDHVYVGTE